MTIAQYEQVEGAGLFQRNGAEFYRLSPAKGARVSGTISVGISSDEQHYYLDSRRVEVTCPSMWIDYTPDFADCSGRSLLTVNGKEYGAGFGNSLSGRVEFLPVHHNREHLAKYYSFATIDGQEYYLSARFNMFDTVSDAARKTLGATVEAIALEYVTDQRWLDYRIARAEYRVERETEAVAAAQTKLDTARQALAELLAQRNGE